MHYWLIIIRIDWRTKWLFLDQKFLILHVFVDKCQNPSIFCCQKLVKFGLEQEITQIWNHPSNTLKLLLTSCQNPQNYPWHPANTFVNFILACHWEGQFLYEHVNFKKERKFLRWNIWKSRKLDNFSETCSCFKQYFATFQVIFLTDSHTSNEIGHFCLSDGLSIRSSMHPVCLFIFYELQENVWWKAVYYFALLTSFIKSRL